MVILVSIVDGGYWKSGDLFSAVLTWTGALPSDRFLALKKGRGLVWMYSLVENAMTCSRESLGSSRIVGFEFAKGSKRLQKRRMEIPKICGP